MQAAKHLGIPTATFNDLCNGSRDEDLAFLSKLAQGMGTTVGALLGDPPSTAIGPNQVLATVGGHIIDPRAYEIVRDGGTLPPGQAWHAKLAPGSYATDEKGYRELLAALPKKRR